MKEAAQNFSYKPGRTVEELENERLLIRLKTSHEERFRKMIALIAVSQKIKEASKNYTDGHS